MEQLYKKSELNISRKNESIYFQLLKYKHQNLIHAKLISDTEEEVKIDYNMDGLHKFEESKKLNVLSKLHIILNLISELEQENDILEWSFTPDNIFYDETLNLKFYTRKIRKNVFLDENSKLVIIKNCLNYVMLDYPYERVEKLDLKAFKNNTFLTNANSSNTIKEIEGIISKELSLKREYHYEKEIIINRNKFDRNRKSILHKNATIVLLVVIITILGAYLLPFRNKEIIIMTNFEQENYTEVLKTYKKVNPKRLNKQEKYYAAYSTVKTEKLSVNQKENILVSITPSADEKVLDYWMYIGRGEFDTAYDMALSLNDIELQTYALLKELDLLNADNSLSASKKDQKRSELQSKIDQNKQILDQQSKEQ